jgi:hypothetical protein
VVRKGAVAQLPLGAGVGGGADADETVTVAVDFAVVSATLVPMTWYVPAVEGAVYVPPLVIVPPALPSCTDHVTPWFELLLTVAEKVRVAPAAIDALEGVTDTATGGGAVTVTVATAAFVASAWLVATT